MTTLAVVITICDNVTERLPLKGQTDNISMSCQFYKKKMYIYIYYHVFLVHLVCVLKPVLLVVSELLVGFIQIKIKIILANFHDILKVCVQPYNLVLIFFMDNNTHLSTCKPYYSINSWLALVLQMLQVTRAIRNHYHCSR